VYSTCLFCHDDLGRNELIEHFPIGRKLAFDAEKGRLWVVCAHCLRWNLTPLEERWEAIEECEREFRGQRLRAQTEHIGLAKTREGLALVRVGRPLRPEFAAWRYGDVFGRRLRQKAFWIGAGVLAASASAGIGLASGVLQTLFVTAPPIFIWAGGMVYQAARAYRDHVRSTYVPNANCRPYLVHGSDIKETDLPPRKDEAKWELRFRHAAGTESLTGDAARRVLGILLTRVNSFGADGDSTHRAAASIAEAGGPEPFVAELARWSATRTADYWKRRALYRRTGLGGEPWALGKRRGPPIDRGALPYLGREERLALEMAVHEEEERRFLEEEVGPLEAAWRDAEEVAKIADDLLTPQSTHDFIAKRRKSTDER
jgi:hypothetical protein